MKAGIILTAAGFVLILAALMFSHGSIGKFQNMEIVFLDRELVLLNDGNYIDNSVRMPTRWPLLLAVIISAVGIVKIMLSKYSPNKPKELLNDTPPTENINNVINVKETDMTSENHNLDVQHSINNVINVKEADITSENHNLDARTCKTSPKEFEPLVTIFKWLVLIVVSLIIVPILVAAIYYLLFGSPYKSHSIEPFFMIIIQSIAGLWAFFVLKPALRKEHMNALER